ncbi:MAG: DUF4268 domain-containing protein [Cyanobacteria bacterium P01_F01_bin.56]
MPFIIQNLIPTTQNLITVTESDSGQLALSRMIEHDFSQLPVIDSSYILKGMITSDSILRAVSYFKITPENLKVSHATHKVKACRIDDDLSELLKALRDTNAIPIVDRLGELKAIVTSYDTAEYFRRRAEDIMLAEDIETTLRDFIESSHRNEAGEIDEEALSQAIQAITPSSKELKKKFKSALFSYIGQTSISKPTPNESILDSVFTKYLDQPIAPKAFEELTLYEFIQIFKNLWSQHSADFKELTWEAVNQLLEDVRQTRNAIAHVREVTPQQREQLKFCAAFLDRHRPVIDIPSEEEIESEVYSQVVSGKTVFHGTVGNVAGTNHGQMVVGEGAQGEKFAPDDETLNPTEEEIDHNDSRYAPLAVWLQSQMSDRITCTFKEIEIVIQDELPPSARQHRNWWANDSVSHAQSIQWLEAGWRVSSVNMSTERVVFSRMGDRQSKYIDFFSQLQEKLQTIDELAIKPQTNPQGRHWFVLFVGPSSKGKKPLGYKPPWIVFSFARKSRFRIETYINEREQKHNKPIFDLLQSQKNEIEAEFGAELSWERLDGKAGSRIAYYRPNSSITDDEETLAQIQDWAIKILPKFYNVLSERFIAAKRQIAPVKNAEDSSSEGENTEG